MTNSRRTVLVFGATGRQGGATARHLLAKGWQVRALTRDASQPAAQALKDAGVEVITGDYGDEAALEAAMRGVYGVFSVQAYGGEEVRYGKLVADTAHAAGVQHFVYSSVQSASDLARVGDASKWIIEQHIWALGLPATILRPSLFMDDVIGSRYGVADGVFSIAFRPDVAIGLIASDDIGALAAWAFENPTIAVGQTIELAGDAITPTQVAAELSQALGRTIPYVQVSIETVEQHSPTAARAFEYLNEVGYTTDVPALRERYAGLMDFKTWLAKVIPARDRAE